jgi:peptidoglycan/LPS O-acetylase OafA/YrhL
MKKAIIVFIVAALVIISIVLWIYSSPMGFKQVDWMHLGIIILLVGFAVFVGYKKLSNAKRGEPAEDELSKKIIQKTAALSYYVSLYFWVLLIFLNDRINLDTEELLGTGILGMAVSFAVCWMIFNFRGLRNE